jgi:uncharacterized repeat protein (TIGR01451 family)
MKLPNHGLHPSAEAAVCAVLFLLLPAAGRAADEHLLSSHVPREIASRHLQPTGNLADTNVLHLAIGLPLRDKAGLDKLLKQIYEPASPNYHQYLSVEQFTENFGPSEADYAALGDFANANQLHVTAVHPNRLLLDIDASVADIRRVFHVNIRTYNRPSDNRQFYAPDSEPTLNLSVPVLHISGLDNYVLPHAFSHKVLAATRNASPLGGATNHAPLGGSGDGGSYFGYDFRNAYAPRVSLTGTGQNCALLEYDGYYTSDITTYEQNAGLPNVTLVNVPIDGGIVGLPGGGVGEVSLDIEMVIAMAPGISKLFVYESPSGPVDDILSRMATDDSSKQISSSWGYGTDPTTDELFQELAVQGQSYYQASGDSDAYVGPISPPEDDPYITLVGGTELVMNGFGVSYASESVWNTGYSPPGGAPQFNNYWGSGGGISTTYPIPSWQQGLSTNADLGSTAFRNTPDVAMTADNIWVYAGNGTQDGIYEGTSCAAPLWNGFTALVNQQASIFSLHPVGFINPAVYAIGKGASYDLRFHDITAGNNFWPGSSNQFPAVPGYDLCTGWGSPTGSNLINTLAPPLDIPALFVVTNSITSDNPNGVINFDECSDVTFLITNEGPAEATSIQGFLYSVTTGAIVAQSTANFPNLPPGTAASSLTPFTISTEPTFICGTPIDLVLILKCNQTVDTNDVELPTGVVGPPAVFGNSQSYPIPEVDPTGIFSPVTVSGLQAAAKITVSVYAQVVYAEGLTFNLISPNGTSITLSEFNGALGANYGDGCSPASETTFDDNALTPIGAGTAPFIGSFQPEQPLSTFLPASGTNLNGVWQLNVSEEFTGDPATLECWSLNIEPYVCEDGGGECPGSYLSLTMSNSPNPVLVFSNLVYTLNVSNAGPSDAQGVVISQSLPPGFSFVTTSNYPVQATASGTNLTLSLGSLPVYATAMVSVVTVPTIPGLATSVATVGSASTELNVNNNTASASTLVVLPSADLGVAMTAAPTSILQGGLVTFTIIVTNNGPYTATGVVLTNFLPANVNYISSSTSQGSISLDGSLAFLGTLPFGSNAVVTETVSPTTTGNITDTAQVGLSPLETDPVSFNNTASFTVTVGPSADLGVSATVTPGTVIAGNDSTYVATVFNNGPSGATQVVFNQTIPGGTGINSATFVSSSQPGVTVTNGSITWNVGNLASGASVAITNVLQSPIIQPGGRPIVLSSTFSVFGQPGDANTNNNVVTVQNVAETPTVTIVPVSATLVSQSGSVLNGAVNPGETVGVELFLQNTGNVSTTNLVATLQATGGVLLPSGYQTYGALAPGAPPVAGSFSFTANSTNGGTVVATLALQDGSANLGTVSFYFYMPVVQTFWNTNAIYIPALQYTPDPDEGPASPYPLSIQVSNVTGYVSKVTVTVSNMSHTFPHDIGLLLVGPGTNAILMDAAANGFSDMTDTTLTFDSTAPIVLPSSGDLTSGTYQPADYNPGDIFTNAVALSIVTNAIVPPYGTSLTNFSGLPPNGTWSLYAHDDVSGDAGGISNGWAVTITTITPVNPTNSLAASIASTNQLILGGSVTNLLNVTNNGATAVSAYLTNVLPAGLTFVSATGSPGSFTQNGQSILYNLGTLSPGAGVTITNVVTANASGLQTNTITTGVPSAAFNIGDNSATAITAVNLPQAELAAGISATPNPAVVNHNVTYTLSVTNLGPSAAVDSTGSFSLTGLQLVSVSPSQGSYVTSNGTVQCALGSISAGNIATVIITAAPLSVGTLTNFWSLSTGSSDTNLAITSASIVVTVTYAVPIIAADGATLLTQGLTPANGAINNNETVSVAFTLTNIGSAPTTNLTAALLASGGIAPITTSQVYGVIPTGGSGTETYSFIATGAPGATVTATLALVDGTNSLGSVAFSFLIPVTTNYANASGITINQFGPAAPYPSEILVSGLTNLQGSNLLVSKVTVTLNGFAHTFPHDVNALLESPSGQELIFMGHAGGPYSATNLTLAFDDAATASLPVGQLVSGTYLPTDYPPVDLFPGLLPASGAEMLAVFNGLSANGIWSLYIYDDTEGNGGVITGGWGLGLTAVNTVNPAALLAAGMIEAPNPVFGGNYLSYQITVTNEGPNTASGVVITDTLPATVTFSSATVSQGSATNVGGTVICSLGSISNGATATATISVIAGAAGTIVNTATVSSAGADLYLAASTAVNTTTVETPPSAFLEATNLPSGLQLTLLGQAGQNYAIQTSSNLLIWNSVVTNTASLATSSFIYLDTRTNAPLRFYRAIRLPQ